MIPGGDVLMFYQDYAHYISITSHSTTSVTDCHMNIMNLKSSCSSWWNHYLGTPSWSTRRNRAWHCCSNSLTNSTAELPKELCRLNTDHWYAPAPAFLYHYWINPWHRLPSRPLNKPTQNLRNLTPPRHPGDFSHHILQGILEIFLTTSHHTKQLVTCPWSSS